MLLTTALVWATKPFLVLNLACLFGIRTGFIVFVTWTELLKATISLHLSLLWRMLMWTVAFLTLPFRVLTAISRERELEIQVQCMRSEVERLMWERMTLEQRLRLAVREHKTMGRMLSELEAEHDMAIAQIQLLRDQLEGLKKENLRLREVRGKDYWGITNKAAGGDRVVVHKLTKHASKQSSDRDDPGLRASTNSGALLSSEGVDRRRRTAIGNSLFSAVLSVSVGAVVWEAKAPCAPLVAALFAVVGISWKSVFEFFSAVKTGPASEAAALLGLNCFILGALVCPALLRVSFS